MISKDRLVRAVKELYRELTPTERAIFGLHIGYPLGPGESLTMREIGEAMRIEPSEAFQRYETIMQRLADRLSEAE